MVHHVITIVSNVSQQYLYKKRACFWRKKYDSQERRSLSLKETDYLMNILPNVLLKIKILGKHFLAINTRIFLSRIH